MRTFFAILAALGLALLATMLTGCAAGQSSPIVIQPGIRQVSTVEGSGTIGSVLIGAFPWTYPIKWSGHGTVTLQYPAQPHILLEGEFEWEPVYPEQAAAIDAERAAGRFLVRSQP